MCQDPDSWEEVLRHIPKLVENANNEMLTNKYLKEEIRDALFQLNLSKAHGMPSLFYQKCWGFIGLYILGLVEDFRKKRRFVLDMNNTVVELIP